MMTLSLNGNLLFREIHIFWQMNQIKARREKSYCSHLITAHRQSTLQEKDTQWWANLRFKAVLLHFCFSVLHRVCAINSPHLCNDPSRDLFYSFPQPPCYFRTLKMWQWKPIIGHSSTAQSAVVTLLVGSWQDTLKLSKGITLYLAC